MDEGTQREALCNLSPQRQGGHGVSTVNILGVRVDAINLAECLATISSWAQAKRGRCVCLANVHMVVETCQSEAYRAVLDGADLVLFDSRVLVWAAALLAGRAPVQIRGTDLVLAACEMAEAEGYSVGFLGGSPGALSNLTKELAGRYPRLEICYASSPPFRALTPDEEREMVQAITAARPALLFVGLGCPRQETWIARHKSSISATMFGVGAAFDFIAGARFEAPRWMQKAGLEWAFRLAQEPRRLFRRYAYTNTYFLVMLVKQLLSRRSVRSAAISFGPGPPPGTSQAENHREPSAATGTQSDRCLPLSGSSD